MQGQCWCFYMVLEVGQRLRLFRSFTKKCKYRLEVGLGHFQRPRKFTAGKIVATGIFPCELTLLVRTYEAGS